ncbi:MAG TPA: ABC transporter permease [Terriglobia bacterium]|nr:ABC transporter permease [Terriglobia bacterium]
MITILQDARYGLRMLARNPAFTAVAVLTLALGIGANTAIFSVIDAVMLRSLPVRDQSQLVVLRWTAHAQPHRNGTSSYGDCAGGEGGDKNPSGCSFPYPIFEMIRSEKEAFSGATAFAGPPQLVLSGNGPARVVRGELVSGDYFSTLGVSALVGRTLGPEDDSPSATPAVVLSYGFWQGAFGGDRSAVGRTISLNAAPFTIVGVTEPSFTSLTPGKTQDMFLPLSTVPRLNIHWGHDLRTLNNWWLVIVARLKPGSSIGRAQAAASLIFRNEMLHGEKPASKAADDPAIVLLPAHSGLSGERGFFSKPLYVLMFVVGFVLLIACANVAGLLLSRAAARQKEMAVRLALGAGRARIMRQLLTESMTLSLGGGVLGVLFAIWGVEAMTALIARGADHPFPFVVAPDWRVLLFTVSISLLTGILFGIAPALRSSRLDLTPALKENSQSLPGGEAGRGRWLQLGKALVVIQVALSMIVLVGAGLMVRTLVNLRSINPGFDTRNLLLFGIDPTLTKYSDSKIQNLYRQLQERLAALPGVTSVSYSSDALLSGSLWTSDLHVEGQPEKSTQEVDMLAAGPDFLKTLRIPLIGGRTFTAADFEQANQAVAPEESSQQAATPSGASSAPKSSPSAGPPIPVLVNTTFVRTYMTNQNPLGKRLTQGDNEGTSGDSAVGKPRTKTWEIIGVAGDTKYNDLRRQVQPAVYVPMTGGGAHFELRTQSNPAALIPVVRKTVNDADSNLPIFDVRTQSERVDELLTTERIISRLASFFGSLALLLACVGLYGLLSYEVARRTREIGIRMALGAESRDVLRRIAGEGIRVTLAGIAAGIIGGLALTRFLSSLLFGLQATDLATFAGVSLILLAVALLACYIPARRATKVDPMVALRYE